MAYCLKGFKLEANASSEMLQDTLSEDKTALGTLPCAVRHACQPSIVRVKLNLTERLDSAGT